ncbi:hypothetical protein ABGV40_18055 [Paenibacillus amylolyticus]|uniref:hypothetical protein n=1 Tax=Paenibacillus amylolyticus TaxID=1451 RepID=UPI0032422E3D
MTALFQSDEKNHEYSNDIADHKMDSNYCNIDSGIMNVPNKELLGQINEKQEKQMKNLNDTNFTRKKHKIQLHQEVVKEVTFCQKGRKL